MNKNTQRKKISSRGVLVIGLFFVNDFLTLCNFGGFFAALQHARKSDNRCNFTKKTICLTFCIVIETCIETFSILSANTLVFIEFVRKKDD